MIAIGAATTPGIMAIRNVKELARAYVTFMKRAHHAGLRGLPPPASPEHFVGVAYWMRGALTKEVYAVLAGAAATRPKDWSSENGDPWQQEADAYGISGERLGSIRERCSASADHLSCTLPEGEWVKFEPARLDLRLAEASATPQESAALRRHLKRELVAWGWGFQTSQGHEVMLRPHERHQILQRARKILETASAETFFPCLQDLFLNDLNRLWTFYDLFAHTPTEAEFARAKQSFADAIERLELSWPGRRPNRAVDDFFRELTDITLTRTEEVTAARMRAAAAAGKA